ncbi:MAG: tetratricopeptide repeat protein [Thermodesulfobacteriota bacterium]
MGWLSYAFGMWVGIFVMAFIPMGIAYLWGWRNSPKWKARFWWITFGLASVISLLIALWGSSNDLSRNTQIMGFFVFTITALIIWGVNRGTSSKPLLRGDLKYKPSTDSSRTPLNHEGFWKRYRLIVGIGSIIILCTTAIFLLSRYKTSAPSPSSITQPPSNIKQLSAYDLYKKGNALLTSGNYNDAIEALSEAIELDPKFALAYYGRGIAYSYLKYSKLAIENYDKAIDLNPNLLEAYIDRGYAYRNYGNPEQAIRDFSKAIELNPKNAMAYAYRGE